MKYRAFISYSQTDKHLARKLQTWLESYRAPSSEGRAKVGAIFRDETHLAGAPDLSEALKANIDDSEALIVLCSPAASKSSWVEREILHFRNTGRGRQIFAVILAGVPNSKNPEEECFPPSFRTGAAANDASVQPVEPFAVNLAAEGRERAFTRLAAGLLSLSFDALWQHQRRRQRIINALFASAAILFLCVAAVAVVFAVLSESRRKQAVEAMDRALERSLAVNALGSSTGNPDRLTAERSAALAFEAHRRLASPESWTAASQALEYLPLAVVERDSEILAAEPSPDGTRLLVVSKDGKVGLHEPEGREVSVCSLACSPTAAAWSPSGRRFAVGGAEGEIAILDKAGNPLAQSRILPDQTHSPGSPDQRKEDAVRKVRFTSESTLLVVGDDYVARVDAATGYVTSQLPLPGILVSAISDGSIAVGLKTGAVVRVEVDDGALSQRPVHTHSGGVSFIDCAQAGRRIASISERGQVHVLTEAGEHTWSIPGWPRLSFLDEGRFLAIWTFKETTQTFSKEGELLNAGRDPGADTFQVLDPLDGNQIWSNQNRYQSDQIVFGGGRVVAIDELVAVRTFYPKSPGSETAYSLDSQVEAAGVLHTGDGVIFAATGGHIMRLDFNTGELRRLARTAGRPSTIQFSPDGRLVYCIGDASENGPQRFRQELSIAKSDALGGGIRLTQAGDFAPGAESGELFIPVNQGGRTQVVRAHVPFGGTTVVASLDGTFEQIAVDPGSGRFLLSGASGVVLLNPSGGEIWRDRLGTFSDGHPRFAAGGAWVPLRQDFKHRILQATNGEEITLKIPRLDTAVLNVSPDGRWFASLDSDWKWVVMDRTTGKVALRLPSNDSFSSAFDPSGRWLAIAEASNNLVLLNLGDDPTHRTISLSWPINRDPIPSKDGHFLLLPGESTLRIVEVGAADPVERILCEGFQPVVAVFDSSAGRIAVGGEDRVARVIDRESGRTRVEQRFSESPTSAVFSRDRRWVAFGSADGVVILFDLESGRLWAEIRPNVGRVSKLSFVESDRWIAVRGDQGVAVLRVDPFQELRRRQGRNLTPGEWMNVGGSGEPPVSMAHWR